MLCVGKRRRDDGHTVLASGGINAALGRIDPEDSWERHAVDTLREGYWLSDPASVELLCREAPRAIEDLVRWGARLAREDDGRLTQRFFGAHRYRRTCFAGDSEGVDRLRELGERTAALEVRPDIAGYADLAHAFDLQGSLLAARATLECALERRETRVAHNPADFPEQDPELRVNLVWTPDGDMTHEAIPAASAAVAALAGGPEPEVTGRLLE